MESQEISRVSEIPNLNGKIESKKPRELYKGSVIEDSSSFNILDCIVIDKYQRNNSIVVA